MQKKLLLVDASSSVFRAFFAIPALVGWTFEYYKGQNAL